MAALLYHKGKIHKDSDAQQGFGEGNPLASPSVQMSRGEKCNNYASKCLHLLTTHLHRFAIWHVESSEALIWRHHRSELVDFVDPGLLFEEGRYQVYQILNHTEIEDMKNIGYDCSLQRDAFHTAEDVF
jgi:hypothetical protein